MFRLGIVGLPNVGKSTLFNALTRAKAQVANYPFTTIEPNVGVVEVPDDRLPRIAALAGASKVTPETVEFVDIAGLVRGASRGEGLGNRFLSHIREVDAIIHVVRCFGDDNVVHVDGRPDPARDIGVIETELILADLETVGKRVSKTEPMLKTGEKRYRDELDILNSIQEWLESGRPVRHMPLGSETLPLVQSLFLLTMKPVVFVANVAEAQASEAARIVATGIEDTVPEVLMVMKEAAGDPVVAVSADLEAQLADVSPDEARDYISELGLTCSALNGLIHAARQALGLITFYTIKGEETRAWTIRRGTLAPAAAGKIHSDMERGFIKAEAIGCEELLSTGALSAARERGRVRTEGKDYVIRDGDVVLFKFNV